MIRAIKELYNTAKYIKKRDPAAKSLISVILLYSGFKVLIYYRVSHYFYKNNLFFIARLVSQFARFITGIEIHPGATIGNNLFIDHGMGIVIGETSIIGDNCIIYQGVTLGMRGNEESIKRHPTLKDNVMLGAGSKILGNITIGNNVKVGANAVVLSSVEDNLTVAGVPSKVIKKNT